MRILKTKIVGCLAITAVVVILDSDSIAAEILEGPGIRHKAVVGAIEPKEFARAARQFLSSPDILLGKYVAYGSSHDRVLAGPRGVLDHCDSSSWRSIAERFSPKDRCPEVRQAIKLGTNIVLRTADRNCTVTESVLAGDSNPLDLVVEGAPVQILEINFSSRPYGGDPGRIPVEVYVRTKATLSVRLAGAVLATVKSTIHSSSLTVVLRSDSWFINECGFPAVLAFDLERGAPPKRDEFLRTRYVSCSQYDPWPVHCFEAESR